MKKIVIIAIIIFLFGATIGRIVVTNFSTFKDFYTMYVDIKKLENTIKENTSKRNLFAKKLEIQEQESKLNPKAREYFNKRYIFKYNDYNALRILNIKKVFDSNTKIYYYQLDLQFQVQKSGTLFGVLNMYYKDDTIEKIFLVNKQTLQIFIKETELLDKLAKG